MPATLNSRMPPLIAEIKTNVRNYIFERGLCALTGKSAARLLTAAQTAPLAPSYMATAGTPAGEQSNSAESALRWPTWHLGGECATTAGNGCGNPGGLTARPAARSSLMPPENHLRLDGAMSLRIEGAGGRAARPQALPAASRRMIRIGCRAPWSDGGDLFPNLGEPRIRPYSEAPASSKTCQTRPR